MRCDVTEILESLREKATGLLSGDGVGSGDLMDKALSAKRLG